MLVCASILGFRADFQKVVIAPRLVKTQKGVTDGYDALGECPSSPRIEYQVVAEGTFVLSASGTLVAVTDDGRRLQMSTG